MDELVNYFGIAWPSFVHRVYGIMKRAGICAKCYFLVKRYYTVKDTHNKRYHEDLHAFILILKMVSAEEVCEDATEVQRDERKQFVDKEDAEQKQDEGDEGDEGDDDDDEDCAACNFCSFAVTGGIPSFQPIFICHECFNENNTSGEEVPLCICQACADNCHNDNNHDVEYVGMGESSF